MKETCPKCKRVIKGAKYYIKEFNQWWCSNCYWNYKQK